MTCLKMGTLRAFLDGELLPSEMVSVQLHISSCALCSEKESQLRETAASVLSQLDLMVPMPSEEPQNSSKSLKIWKERTVEKYSIGNRLMRRFRMINQALSRTRWRYAALTAGLVVMSLLVAFTPAGSAAENFLSVFRVKKFQAVTLNPSDVPKPPTLADIGVMEMGSQPKTKKVSSQAEASTSVGFSVALPSVLPNGFANTPDISVSDGTSFKMTFDLQKIESYLAAVGIRGVDLPANLNGATIRAEVPAQVAFSYRGDGKYLTGGATKSPTLDVPPDLDVEYLREQLLKFPGLSRETQAQLRSITDWKETMIVPVPSGSASRDVSINGAEGVLISNDRSNGSSAVLWQRNDVVYGLSGNVSQEELLAAARSLK